MAAKSITNAAAIVMCDGIVDLVDGGTPGDATGDIKIYDGSIPADADTALSGNTLLAELNFSNPAFGAAADAAPGAIATANAIANDVSADATGTASFFRVTDRANAVVWQGDVTATAGGGDMELNTVSIVAAAVVSISAFTVTMPES